jgi:hypothetical protein
MLSSRTCEGASIRVCSKLRGRRCRVRQARAEFRPLCCLDKPKPRFCLKVVGSRRVGQVRFRAISGDHPGATIAHLHADIGSGEVIVELLPNGECGSPERTARQSGYGNNA